MLQPEQLVDAEWAEWYRLTPVQRWMESEHRTDANPARVKFWLQELRTPELLIEVAQSNAALCRRLVSKRPPLAKAVSGDARELEQGLRDEELAEREIDRRYWLPLRKELEALRRAH